MTSTQDKPLAAIQSRTVWCASSGAMTPPTPSTYTPGSIVNVGSTTGHGGQTKLSAYAMSKGALTIMTKNLAFGLMLGFIIGRNRMG